MARDFELYERRIAEERAAAAEASDPVVRDRHDELAQLYADRLKAMSSRQARPMRLVIDEALV